VNEQISLKVQEYYGEVLQSNKDIKTSACCQLDSVPAHLRPLITNIHPEVRSKSYGCGSPIPYCLQGKTALDLGCGTGIDVYTMSQLVGNDGKVIGVDMTENQLKVANQYIDYHMKKFGFEKPNVTFHFGKIEELKSLGIEDNSIDVITSNCVINLSANKEAVFKEIFRVLKPGGELYFSDVFSTRRVPEHLADDTVILGECLGGAMYLEDFRRTINKIGCADFRITSQSAISIDDPEIFKKVGMINFCSMTIRAFKCDFEDICENYGHVAYYLGTIPEAPHSFILDDHHEFKTGMPVPVCGNTAIMLSETRFTEHFRVEGDFSTHFGAFECNPNSLNHDAKLASCC